MFSFFKSLFGAGSVRIEFVAVDSTGKKIEGTAQMPYRGEFSREAVLTAFKNQMRETHSLMVQECAIVVHAHV